MQRLLSLSAIALLAMTTVVPVPAQASGSYPLHFGAGNLPDDCADPASLNDGCYHIRNFINPLTTPVIDVLIVPPASPMPERDMRIMRQAIEMWDAGIHYLALDMGLGWLADGVAFNILVDDGSLTSDPLWDPEVVVIASNPVGGAGIGITPLNYKLCKGANPLASGVPWDQVPGFDNHHGSSGTYVDSCNGDAVCYAINGAIDPEYNTVNLFNLFDLVAHEVGHCLTVGHVGNGLDHSSAMVPCYDIMAYQDGCDWPAYPLRCVSTLDVESFAIGLSPAFHAKGLIPAVLQPNHSPFQAQDPDQHYYASSTGSPEDCIQPDVGPVAGEPVDFYPTGGGGSTSVPEIAILSPEAGATVSGPVTVSGTVELVEQVGAAAPSGEGASRPSLPLPGGSGLPVARPAAGLQVSLPVDAGADAGLPKADAGDGPSGVRGFLNRLWDRIVGNDKAAAKHNDGGGEVPVTSLDVRRVELVDTTAADLVIELEVEGMDDLPPSVEVDGLGGLSVKHGVSFCTAKDGVPANYAAGSYGAGASECYTIELTQGALGDVLVFSTVSQDGSGCGALVPSGMTATVDGDIVRIVVPRAGLTLRTPAADLNGCLDETEVFGGTGLADGERITYLLGQTRASAGLGVTYNPTVDTAGGVLNPAHTVTSAATDADGDGILDGSDACPGTPAGTAVGPDGCPLDTGAGEVLLFVGETVVGATSVDPEASPAWSIAGVDLSEFPGEVVLEAVWFDSGHDELDRASVALTVESLGCGAAGSGHEDGGGANACLGNKPPQILEDTLALSATLLEEDGGDHDLVLSVAVRDLNRADHLDVGSLAVDFSPSDEVTVDEAAVTTEATEDDTVVVLHVPVTVGTGATVGLYDVSVRISDRGVAGHESETVLRDSATFEGVLELLPAGDLVVSVAGGDALDFGAPGPGDEDVESLNHFVVRNALHEEHDILFAMDDFANLEEQADCSDPEERDCIRVVDNLVALVDVTPEGDGSFTFTDATEVLYTQEFESLGSLADGAAMGVKLRILEIGSVHPGTYGTTFSVVEL